MEYTNSPLATSSVLSPNYTNDRVTINRITPHHAASNPITAVELASSFLPVKRQASCNYAIGNDGSCCLGVPEKFRSWCSSNPTNDRSSITYEISNSYHGEPWPISNAAYDTFIKLSADICRRYNKKGVFNIVDEIAKVPQSARAKFANNYVVPEGMILLTQHNYFDATACPGTTLKQRFKEATNDINALLGGSYVPPKPLPAIALPTLRKGMRGEQVRILQSNLMALGIALPKYGADGDFGAETFAAVVAFQKIVFPNQPKEWDGIYGSKSYNAMASAIAKL